MMSMCVDYRKLNSITQRESFPVPNIEDTLNLLAKKRIFTSLDLLSGYYQVPIAEDSRSFTAFVTPTGHYEFKRVPFGLTNSPAVFMKLMKKVTQQMNANKVIVYMDDILIPSETIEENLEILQDFLRQLRKAGLTLNLKKCSFLNSQLHFLGHEISSDGIKPGTHKVAAVENFKQPETIKEVRQFLGLAGYFHRFVKNFSEIALPLNKLLKKNASFEWTQETENAFRRLREILSKKPVLAIFESEAEHELHTDASSHGIAGILMQRCSDGLLRPVSYFSRSTTPGEEKFHSYELETLAVVESMERFKYYLLNRHFKVVTDCNSLKMTQEKRDLVPRIARWWLKISEYDFEMIFRPGNKMEHADALSRRPYEQGTNAETVSSKILLIGVPLEDWLVTLQQQDPRIVEITKILDGTDTQHKDTHVIKGNYILKENRLFKKTATGDKFVVPKGVRWRVIKSAHDDMGHCGITKTYENLHKMFWFTNMKPVVTKYVNSCIDCLYNKRGRDETNYLLHSPEKLAVPFHTIHVDHLGPFPKSKRGNCFVIGLVDAFTKFAVFKAVRTTNAKSVLKMLDEVSQYFGMPTRIISDRGSAFTSKEFEKYCAQNAIKHVLNAVKTPRANGQVERYFRTLRAAIASSTKEEMGRDWDENIANIQWAFNSMKHSVSRASPQELMMGFKPRSILRNKLILALQEWMEEEEDENTPLSELREKVQQRMAEKQRMKVGKFNESQKSPKTYTEGELVLIRQEPASTGQPRKVLPRYKGPYQVKAILPNDRYVVADAPNIQITQKPYESVHSADRMKKWCNLIDLSFDGDTEEEEEEENKDVMEVDL